MNAQFTSGNVQEYTKEKMNTLRYMKQDKGGSLYKVYAFKLTRTSFLAYHCLFLIRSKSHAFFHNTNFVYCNICKFYLVLFCPYIWNTLSVSHLHFVLLIQMLRTHLSMCYACVVNDFPSSTKSCYSKSYLHWSLYNIYSKIHSYKL